MSRMNAERTLTQFDDGARLSDLPRQAQISGNLANVYESLAQEIIDSTERGFLYGDLLKTDIQVISVEYFDEGNALMFVAPYDDTNYYRMCLRNDNDEDEYKNDTYSIIQIAKQTARVVRSISFSVTDADKLICLRYLVSHHYNKHIKGQPHV